MRCGFSVTISRWLSRIRRRTRERLPNWLKSTMRSCPVSTPWRTATAKTASSYTPAASAAMWSRQSSGRTSSSSMSPRISSRRSTPAWSRFRPSAWCRTAKRFSIPAHRRRLKSAVCWQRFWTSRRRISALSSRRSAAASVKNATHFSKHRRLLPLMPAASRSRLR